MDFAKTEIQAMLVDSAQRLLAEEAGVEYWRSLRETSHGFAEHRWNTFAELGWLALAVPEHAGGLGGSLEDAALLGVELGRTLATEPFAMTAVGAAHILAAATDNAPASAALADVGRGALRVAIAIGEPLTGRRTLRGLVVSGRRPLVVDAPSAGRLILPVAIEEETALYLIDTQAAGLRADCYPLIDGTRAADLFFEEVALPADAMIAGPGRGAALLGEAAARLQVMAMAQSLGSMEQCLRICGDYAKERKQFGAAIGSFQAIQHMLVDMFVAVHQARSMLYHALAHAEAEPAIRDAAIAASRIVFGDAAQLVSRSGVQLHGGYGLTDEYAISHHFRRLMVLNKLGGDLETHLDGFGRHVLSDREPAVSA